MVKSKQCTSCKEVKSYTEFRTDNKQKDRLSIYCKSCKSIMDYIYREKKKGTVFTVEEIENIKKEIIVPNKRVAKNDTLIKEGLKKCSKCKKIKSLEEFGTDNKTKDKKSPSCKECEKKRRNKKEVKERMKEYQKEYQKNNKEELKEKAKVRAKTYYQENKVYFLERNKKRQEQLKSNGGKHGAIDWAKCLNYFDYKDAYTGEPLTNSNVSKDHITPVIEGGNDNINNIVPCIRGTNKAKNDAKSWVKWYRKQEFYSLERENKIKQWIKLNS